jgi:hypothetical protein
MEKGYALRLDSAHLVVRDIPYLDSQKALQIGAFVTKLEFIDNVRVKQQDHQVFFAGSPPYGLNGQPIPNLAGGPTSLTLAHADVLVQRTFSNKPSNGFANFFDKIEHYVGMISGPAIELCGANPLTFRVDTEVVQDSVFKFHDTLTSRAEIGDLATRFKNEVVAIIGLGGTGAYVLDFFVKAPVKQIRGFDGDAYHVHNAYRSPGRLEEKELSQGKADVYRSRYENFREGVLLTRKYIDRSCAADFEGVTFAFVCVDKGSARAEIFELLLSLGIPFIDVGMGLTRNADALTGMMRATYYSAADGRKVRQMGLAEMSDDPNDVYRQNIQIAELNALNAALAVIRYKQIRGFYANDNGARHMLFELGGLKLFAEAFE